MAAFQPAGIFEGVRVYESSLIRKRAAIALPGIGIVLYPGGKTKDNNLNLLRHEFGHFLQAKQTGLFLFYFGVGIPSLLSAWRNPKQHSRFWTEIWADALSHQYFAPK